MGPLDELIQSLSKIPGLGRKSAARMVFYLMRADASLSRRLGDQIATLKDRVLRCSECGNYTEQDPCPLCTDPTRDSQVLCVVEGIQDLMSLQATGEFRGLYQVLHGVLSPLDGVGPEELGLGRLERRVSARGVREVIVATNNTMEGDTTALYIARLLKPLGIKVTRLASGLPVGGDLEYADRQTVSRSLRGRIELD